MQSTRDGSRAGLKALDATAPSPLKLDDDTNGSVIASERDRSLESEDRADREQRARSVCSPNEPRVGMTEQEVLSTCWGKPRYRRRTGVEGLMRDQWVYGDGKYLYFDNGHLLAIEQ